MAVQRLDRWLDVGQFDPEDLHTVEARAPAAENQNVIILEWAKLSMSRKREIQAWAERVVPADAPETTSDPSRSSSSTDEMNDLDEVELDDSHSMAEVRPYETIRASEWARLRNREYSGLKSRRRQRGASEEPSDDENRSSKRQKVRKDLIVAPVDSCLEQRGTDYDSSRSLRSDETELGRASDEVSQNQDED